MNGPGLAREAEGRGSASPDESRQDRNDREGDGTGGPPAKRRHGLRWLLASVALAVAGGAVAWGIVRRDEAVASLKVAADTDSVPRVTLVSPRPGPATRTLVLPGETQAWYQAPIFAQVTGYVQMWYKDYGASVHKGELLATIDTPDLDQELQQAQARLQVAQSKASLARVTAARWQKLAGTQAVSQEAVDVNNANAREAQSEVQAAQFDVGRYQAQEAFKRVVAPFDGVVTARNTDIGAYVNASGATANQRNGGQSLFTVSDLHEIRIFVSVPQDYSNDIKPGLKATMTLPQFPGRVFDVDVSTLAKSFDPATRTVTTELTIPNPAQELWPGAYVQVTFSVPSDPNITVIPEQAMLFRAQGPQVALVRSGNKVHLQDIKLGLNLGTTVQVTQGLKPDDKLVANPSAGLLEGQAVDVVNVPPQNSDDDGSPGQGAPVQKPPVQRPPGETGGQ